MFDTKEKANLLMKYLIQAFENKDNKSYEFIKEALCEHLNLPHKKLVKKIQAEMVSTDFPIITRDSFNVTIGLNNFDMGWEQAFKTVMLGEKQDSWQIYDVNTSALSFRKVEEGGRVQVDELTGSIITAYVDYYGAALGWTDKMMRYRRISTMIDMLEIFRNKFWENKANNHYALLAAAAILNITAYQGAANDGQLRRDIQTINLAAYTLGNRCRNKGYGDAANTPFVLYANPFDEARIEACFNALTSNLATALNIGQQITARRITRIYTFNANILQGSPLLIWPGNKLQRADDMQPTPYEAPVDSLTLSKWTAVWAIYGAIVADTDQCQTLTLG